MLTCERINGGPQDDIHFFLHWMEEDVKAGAADLWEDPFFLLGLLCQSLLLGFLLGLQPFLLIFFLLLFCLFGRFLRLLLFCFFLGYALLFLQSDVVILSQNRC